MHAIEIIGVGDELGFIIPDDMLKNLRLKLGDELRVSDMDRGVLLTPIRNDSDPDVMSSADA